MSLVWKILFIINFFAGSLAWALDFPPLLQQAKVLPFGDSTFSITGVRTQLNNEYNHEGRQTSGPDLLLREFSWSELIQQAKESSRAVIKEQQIKAGQKDEDIAVRELIHSTGERVIIRPFWAFGVSDRWTVGARVPIVAESRKVKQTMEWVNSSVSPSISVLNDGLVSKDLTGDIGPESRSRLDGLDSGIRYHIGDVEILGNYLLKQRTDWAWVFRQKVVLPTSPPPDPYSLDPIVASEGQTDLGVDSLWQWWAASRWSILASLGYLWQLPNRVSMRVPDTQRSFLGRQIDTNILRDPGEKATAEVMLRWELISAWHFRAGYSYAQKSRDKYSGKMFKEYQYRLMGLGTDSKRSEGRLGFSYLPPSIRQIWGRSLRLLGAHIDMYSPLGGVNSSAETVAEFGLSFIY